MGPALVVKRRKRWGLREFPDACHEQVGLAGRWLACDSAHVPLPVSLAEWAAAVFRSEQEISLEFPVLLLLQFAAEFGLGEIVLGVELHAATFVVTISAGEDQKNVHR